MNTHQINSCLQSTPTFYGTFASDDLSPLIRKKRPFCFVANTDKKSGKGKHWVAFYVDKNCIEFYDTYGRDLLPCFKYFVRKRKYIYNKKRVQSFGSTVCGHHCIYFIYQRQRGQSMQKIVQIFTKNCLLNDSNVRDWVISKFADCSPKNNCKSGQNCKSYNCLYHLSELD